MAGTACWTSSPERDWAVKASRDRPDRDPPELDAPGYLRQLYLITHYQHLPAKGVAVRDQARILLVDDDSGARESVSGALSATGYVVETATCGRDGLDTLARQPCDVAIVDMRLPDMSGLDLLRAIKTSSPATEVIVITGYASLSSAIQAIDGPVFAYVEKPVEMHPLFAMVGRALERKRAREALCRSEQELADFFENATVGLHWVGADGSILRVNQAELDLLGYTREEYVGHHIAEFHADREVIDDILERLARDETLRNYEARLRAKDGSIKHVLIDSNVLWGDGRFIHARSVTRDITDRRRTEEVAWALTQVGHELTGTLDLAQATDRVVSTVLRLFGVRRSLLYELDRVSGSLVCVAAAGEGSPGDWIGRTLPVGAAVSGLAVAEARAIWSADLLIDPRIALPEWVRERIRQEGHGAGAAAPLTARGETLGALSLGDTTGRVFTEGDLRLLSAFADQAALAIRNARLYEEVRNARDFLQSIAQNSADAIVTTDGRGRVTYVSPGAEAMFGYRAAEVLGRPAADYYRSGRAEARAVTKRLGAEGQIRNYETALRAKDGRWVTVSASISLLRGAAGAVIGTLGVIKDMTEREAAEAARREVAELRAVTLVAGGVAHEIINPLTALIGQLEMLAWDLPTEGEAAKRIKQALAAAERIEHIVARMTKISRIETTPTDNILPPVLDIQKSSDVS